MASKHVRLTRLDRRPDGSYLLGFASPDRATFAAVVAAIKDRIPYWGRRYEPDQRAWWVATEAHTRSGLSRTGFLLSQLLRTDVRGPSGRSRLAHP